MVDLSGVKIKTTILFGLACMAFAVVGGAQGFSRSSGRSTNVPSLGNQPIAVGPFLFSPALQLSWENHSNVWRSSSDPVEDDLYFARMRFMFQMPIRESFVRISYTPTYRKSKVRVFRSDWEHNLEVLGDFVFAGGLTLKVNYNYFDGDSSVGEVDPGGELVYRGQPFIRHGFGIDAGYWFSATDGLALNVSETKVEWEGEPVSGSGSWFDYRQSRARAGWLHQLSPSLIMDVSLGFGDYSTDDVTDKSRDYTAIAVTAGLRGQLNDVLSTEVRFGYGQTDFSGAASAEPDFEDFSGLVIDGSITWALGSESTLRLNLLRGPFASNYDLNSYYTATGGRLLFDVDRGRFFGQASILLQNNSYGVPDSVLGIKRSDDLMILGTGVGFRITDRISVRAAYSRDERESFDPYGYVNDIWLLDMIFGY